MNLPKSVAILGRVYKVKKVTSEQMIKATESNAVGALNFSDKTILIKEGMSKEDEIVTLFHEVCHVAQITSGLNQTISAELAEVWCETVANSFYQLLKNKR